MKCAPRPDDFEARRERLRALSDEELHGRFWSLVERVVAPLVEEARNHTTESIERSVLLRMGFSSVEAGALASRTDERGLLAHGAGALVLKLAQRRGVSVRDAGLALLDGRHWDELAGGLAP
jgi:D-ornithine 4,5-aminomutase subunit alpha